ncbi:MAG: SUMF1/EgtB/PvdO family nonheme iron enzyme [Verrucomicrobiota bacterium]|nr:SUMF1/EgtB/PvdO family nonheme iron enzyme [Verrucomicrobiota bacterium]
MTPDGDSLPKSAASNTDTDLFSPGQTIGEYKVMRCLFYSPIGGFYVLHSITSGSLCSAFIFPMGVAADGKFPERFHDYSARIANITHPNVLHAKRPDIIEGRYCLIYESVEGVSAENYLEELSNQKRDAEKLMRQTKQPFVRAEDGNAGAQAPQPGTPEFYAVGLAQERSRVILGQVAVALKMAHDQGLHHYSLTLNHVLLGHNDHAQIWGLGLYELIGEELFQRLISQGVPPLRSNQKRRITNPVDYLPPEVRRGAKLDARSDVYGIGLSGYQLITGIRLGTNYIAPSQINTTISSAWDALLAGCLQNEPANRPQTVGAVLKEIEAMAPKVVPGKKDAGTGGLGKQLEKIHLPGALGGNASPKKKQSIRLVGIGILALLAVAGGIKSYQILANPDDALPGPQITRTTTDKVPDLRIKLNTPNARVTFSGANSGSVVTYNGIVDVNLPRGDYKLTIESPNYKSIDTSITLGREAQEITHNLVPNFATVQVNGPIGARLYTVAASGLKRFVGQITEEAGATFTANLFARQYDLEVSMPGYTPQSFPKLTLTAKATVLDAKLVPIPARLKILSAPPGATVTIAVPDKAPTTTGTTPIDAEDLPVLQPLSISVTHPLYRTRTINLTLKPGQKDTLDFGTLEPKTGDLSIRVTLGGVPANLNVLNKLNLKIDDTRYPLGSGQIKSIPAGERRLEITHPDYKTYSELFKVPDGDKVELLANLPPKPGLVTITVSNDLPFEFAVDGQVVAGKGNVFEVPPGAERQIEVRIRDFFTVKRTLKLGPNESISWKVAPERIPMPTPTKNYTVPYLDAAMLWVQPGSYKIGSPIAEQARVPNENDGRSLQPTVVFTKGFWMQQFEVTQREYQYIAGKNPSLFKDPRKPVEQITWYEAVAFARQVTETERKAGRLPEGYVYRLPTQAEWEYACRAGTTTPFSWGDEANPTRGNFKGVYPREIGTGDVSAGEVFNTTTVGSYPPNPWGFYDMHGNVKEWCFDPFNERYPSGTLTDWTGETSGTSRPLRGGGWDDPASASRSASRDRASPSIKQSSVGMRLVLGREIAEAK